MSLLLSGQTILITGAGGPAIHGMITSLSQSGATVIAVDMLDKSSGFYISDKSYVVPPGTSPDFYPKILDICKTNNVSAVVSVVDEELPHVSGLEAHGIPVIQPRAPFVNFALDKFVCMNELMTNRITAPPTFLLSSFTNQLPFPLFLKPRVGRGSRGASKIADSDALAHYINTTPYSLDNIIVQPYIAGTEYTVSVIVTRDGTVHSIVPKRIIKKDGVTKLAVTESVPAITSLCESIQHSFSADGPFNIQLIVDNNGIPYPFEINPRLSTSTTLTAASGVDELVGLIHLFLNPSSDYTFNDPQDGIVLVRHVVDQFMTLDRFNNFDVNKP